MKSTIRIVLLAALTAGATCGWLTVNAAELARERTAEASR
jgi:hypothetical protein